MDEKKSIAITDNEIDNSPLIIDIGKQSRKSVRSLRKGKGKLLGKVDGHIQRLVQMGEINADAQTVIVVVSPKKKRLSWF
jgi:hypothetical protein